MTVEASIHTALMARAETIPGGYAVAWPGVPFTETDEYLAVSHLPNNAERVALHGTYGLDRMGILQITLCAPLGKHEAVYIEQAGQIAEHFPRDLALSSGGVTVRVVKAELGPGFADGQHWRVPVSVYYRGRA
jgi:hypothetical protein